MIGSYSSGRARAVILALMVAILLLAAATRILNIDGPSLWIDEGFTYYTFKADFWPTLLGDRHPPFYFVTLHLWAALTGDSILALRYWSFLPSLLSIAAIYQIGREGARYSGHSGSPEAVGGGLALLAALLLALADGENYLAQELRMYTWQVCLCAFASLFYLRWVRLPNRGQALLWVAGLTAALYTHYFSAYVVIVHGLHALLVLPLRRKIAAVSWLTLTGSLFMPWVLIALNNQFRASDACFACGESMTLSRLLDFRDSWLGDLWPLLGLIMVFGVVYGGQSRSLRRLSTASVSFPLFLLLLLLVPLVLTFAVSHRWLEFFNHHLAQLSIPVALLIALGLARLNSRTRIALVAAIVIYGVTTVDWYRQKVPWEALVAQFAPYVQPDHLVLSEIGAEEAALGYYFDHLLPAGVQQSAFTWWGPRDVNLYYNQQLPPLIAGQHARQVGPVTTAWFVYWNANTAMRDQLAANGFTPTMTFTVEHLGVTIPAYRYDVMPGGALASFEGGLVLRTAEIDTAALRVDLWWSLDAPTTTAFVTKAFLLDANGLSVAQMDSPPQFGQRPAPTFGDDEVVYDPKPLRLNEGLAVLPPGGYTVAVQVYYFENDQIVLQRSAGEEFVVVGRIE